MPYDKLSAANPAILGIEPPVTLAQANLIAEWADEIERSDADVESPWAVAISNFKNEAYHVEDGKWVKNKSTVKEVSFDERIRHIRDAWQAQFSRRDYPVPETISSWLEEVFEDKVTVSTPKGLVACPYTIQEDGTVLFGEPVQVKAREDEEPGTEVVQGALARFFESLTGLVTEAVQGLKARGEGLGVGGPRQGIGGPAMCVCPECGYEAEHKAGVPCTDMVCPECDTTLQGTSGKAKEDNSREAAREAQAKRSKKWGIAVLETGSSLTIPKKYEAKGATFADFADPTNVKYPVWLTESRDDLDVEQLGQVRNAPARFAQFKDNYDTKSRGVVADRIKKALKKFEIGEYGEKSVFIPVIKGKDGADWWLAYSGTAFEDLEQEIISRKAIDFGIAYADETGERGDLQLFHLPVRVGSCEVQLREGCFLIEAGRWDETGVAVATKEAIRSNPEAWKMSVGFEYNDDYFIDGVYTDQVRFLERSVVKANRAACPFTAILVSREVDMSTKTDLLELLGDEDLVEKVLTLAAQKTDELAQLVAFKQKADGDADADEPGEVLAQIAEMGEEALKELQDAIGAKLRGEAQDDDGDKGDKGKVAPSVVEISEDVIKAIAAEVAQALDFETKLAAMNEQLGALSLTVEEQGITVTGVKQLLETDIDKEVMKRVEGLPTARFVLAEKDKLFRQSQESPDETSSPMPVVFQSPLAAFGQVYNAMQSKK